MGTVTVGKMTGQILILTEQALWWTTVDKTFMSTLKFKSQQSTNFPGPLAERKTRVSAGRALSLPVPWLELLQRVLGKHFQHEDHCWGQSGTELGS